MANLSGQQSTSDARRGTAAHRRQRASRAVAREIRHAESRAATLARLPHEARTACCSCCVGFRETLQNIDSRIGALADQIACCNASVAEGLVDRLSAVVGLAVRSSTDRLELARTQIYDITSPAPSSPVLHAIALSTDDEAKEPLELPPVPAFPFLEARKLDLTDAAADEALTETRDADSGAISSKDLAAVLFEAGGPDLPEGETSCTCQSGAPSPEPGQAMLRADAPDDKAANLLATLFFHEIKIAAIAHEYSNSVYIEPIVLTTLKACESFVRSSKDWRSLLALASFWWATRGNDPPDLATCGKVRRFLGDRCDLSPA